MSPLGYWRYKDLPFSPDGTATENHAHLLDFPLLGELGPSSANAGSRRFSPTRILLRRRIMTGSVGAPVDMGVPFAGMTVQRYSKSQVKRAGDIIIARNPYPYSEEVREAFRLAHAWRDLHVVPMRAARKELKHLAGKAKVKGQAVGRLKRFQSIRRKMRRRPLSLYQMQDIAGVRIIVDAIADVDAVAERYRAGHSRHPLLAENDYIASPKPGGYRSIHFTLKHQGDEEQTAGNRLTVEVQIRTRLQHAWATAVEAVGTVRNEELKGGVGNADWLRLFEIMSAEFSVEERRPICPGVSRDEQSRREELLALDARLDAIATLEGYRNAIREINQFSGLRGSSFIITFNSVTRKVTVKTNATFAGLAADYERAESNEAANAVLVEVDKVDDLISAYPNYFLDVAMFTERLRSALGRRAPVALPTASRSMSEWMAFWALRTKKWKRIR